MQQRPAMGLNRHSSIGESEGNLGAEICYYIWSSIAVGERIISDFCSKIINFGERKKQISDCCSEIINF